MASITISERVHPDMARVLQANPELVTCLSTRNYTARNTSMQYRRNMVDLVAEFHDNGFALDVEYTDTRKYARGNSMQYCVRELRGCMRRGMCRDVDMCRAYATLMREWCKMSNVDHNYYKHLNNIIKNRDTIIAGLVGSVVDTRDGSLLTADQIKSIINSVPTGGCRFYNGALHAYAKKVDATSDRSESSEHIATISDGEVVAFCQWKECQKLIDRIVAANRPIYDSIDHNLYNRRGKTVSRVLAKMEWEAVSCMMEKSVELGVAVCGYEFDGFAVQNVWPDGYLRSLELAVRERHGWSIKMAAKEFKAMDLRAAAAELGVPFNEGELYDRARAQQERLVAGELFPEQLSTGDDVFEDKTHLQQIPNGMWKLEDDILKQAAKFVMLCAAMSLGKSVQLLRTLVDFITRGRLTVEEYLAAVAAARAEGGQPAVDAYVLGQLHESRRGAIVMPSFRRMYATTCHELLHSLGFITYNDKALTKESGIALSKHPLLIVEVESFFKVKTDTVVSAIIMDEGYSLERAYVSPTNGTNGSLIEHHEQVLRKWMETPACEKVWVMDADLKVDGSVDSDVKKWVGWCTEWRVQAKRSAAHEAHLAGQGAEQQRLDREAHELLEHPKDKVVRVNVTYRPMKREVVFMPTHTAELRMLAVALEAHELGEQILVCCGSKHDANTYKQLLEAKDLTVGLYTSETVTNDTDIKTEWPQFDVVILTSTITAGADYYGAVREIFQFPCAGTTTAQQAMQQSGRARVPTTLRITVGTSETTIKTAATTRAKLDAMYAEERQRLVNGMGHNKRYLEQAVQALADHMDPTEVKHMLDHKEERPLLGTFAYVAAERRMCSTLAGHVSFQKYMCRLKGYDVGVDTDEPETEEEYKQREQQLKQLKDDLKNIKLGISAERLAAYDAVVVEPFLDDAKMDALENMAAGGVYMNGDARKAFFGEHPTITEKTVRLAVEKAQACRACNVPNMLSATVRTVLAARTALEVYGALRSLDTEDGGVQVKLREAAKHYANKQKSTPLEMRTEPALVRVRHISAILMKGGTTIRTVAECGETGDSIAVDPKRFDGVVVTTMLNEAAAVGVCPFKGSNNIRIKQMLQTNLGCNYSVKEGTIKGSRGIFAALGVYNHQPIDAADVIPTLLTDGLFEVLGSWRVRQMAAEHRSVGLPAFERQADRMDGWAERKEQEAEQQRKRAASSDAEGHPGPKKTRVI